jgi:hypothetical protein
MISKQIACSMVATLVLLFANTINAAQLLFTPTLVLSEEYTDNLFLTDDNEVDDYITTAGVGLNGQVLWRTAGLEIDYTPSYNTFADNSDLDYWRHLASFLAWKEFKRNTRLELRNTYLRTSDPRDQSGALDEANPLLGSAIETDINRRDRNEYFTNATDLRLSHQFGVNDNVYLAYRYSFLREVDTVAGQAGDDNDIKTASGGIEYDITNRWTTQLDIDVQDSDYEEESDRVQYNGRLRVLYNFSRSLSTFVAYRHTVLDFDGDADEDYKIYQPTVGLEKRFDNNSRISIGVGYYFQDFETSDDDSSPIAETEIYKRWRFRTAYFEILGTSGYEVDDEGVEDNGLRVYYSGRVGMGYQFSRWLSSDIFATYGHDDYPNAVPDRVDITIGAGAGIDWQLLRWLTTRLEYNYIDVDSDMQEDSYKENSVLLTITITPSSPYRLN